MRLLGIIFVPDWFVIVGYLLLIVFGYLIWNYGYFQNRGIPWATPFIFFGSLYTDLNKVLREEDILKAKKYKSVYGFFEGRKPTIRIAKPDLLKKILTKQFDNFTDRRTIELKNDTIRKKNLCFINGAEWRRVRNVLTPAFTSEKLKQMGPLIEEAVNNLIEILEEKSKRNISVHLQSQFEALVMDITATCAFGMKINSQKNPETLFAKNVEQLPLETISFIETISFNAIITEMMPNFIKRWFNLGLPKLDKETVNFFKDRLMQIIKTRKEQNVVCNDFLQLLLEAQEREESELAKQPNFKKVLTMDGVLAQSITFLLTGLPKVTMALTIVCYQLALNEDIQTKLSNEIDEAFSKHNGQINYDILESLPYLEIVLMESLRWFPPWFRIERVCVNDTKVDTGTGNLKIKKGDLISIPIHAIHHNEEHYPNPQTFDPERFSKDNETKIPSHAFLPFGKGPRNCIGIKFAMMEIKFILAHLVHQFKILRCAETTEPLQGHPAFTALDLESGVWVKFEKK